MVACCNRLFCARVITCESFAQPRTDLGGVTSKLIFKFDFFSFYVTYVMCRVLICFLFPIAVIIVLDAKLDWHL